MEEAEAFIEHSTEIMMSAKFDLRGWRFNEDKSTFHLTGEESPAHEGNVSVLGLEWNPKDDTLRCAYKHGFFNAIPLTKRSTLSSANQPFDPLGILSPVTLRFKILMQDCWSAKLSWDAELSDELAKKILKLERDLNYVDNLTIPRRLVINLKERNNLSFHIFCDASQLANASKEIERIEERIENAVENADSSDALFNVLKTKVNTYEQKLENSFSNLDVNDNEEKLEKYLEIQDVLFECAVLLENTKLKNKTESQAVNSNAKIQASKKLPKLELNRHHTLLHKYNVNLPTETDSNPDVVAVSNRLQFETNQQNSSVLLSTALIKVEDHTGKFIECRALIDNASQLSLISKKLADQLKLPLKNTNHKLTGINGISAETSLHSCQIEFTPHFSSKSFNLIALVVNKVTPPLPNFDIQIQHWPHLDNLILSDPNFYISQQIDILLGADIYALLLDGLPIFGPSGTPTAISTKLGYILTRKIYTSQRPDSIVHSTLYDQSIEKIPPNVDDLLAGADTEEEAKATITKIQNLMKSGGFSLRKWSSSHKIILKDLDKSFLATESIHSLCDEEVKQWVLGIFWNLLTDSIQVRIADGGNLSDWYHIPGKLNPADCATRGLFPEQLKDASYWWNGPDWIKQEFHPLVPSLEVLTTNLDEPDSVPEPTSINADRNPLNDVLLKFSSYTKLIRVFAWMENLLQLKHQFWNRWTRDVLHHLHVRRKWHQHRPPLSVDLVLIQTDNMPPLSWPLARILEIIPGTDGIPRVALLCTPSGPAKRAINRFIALPVPTCHAPEDGDSPERQQMAQ
ncbi:hypothetical protein HNY73_019417 [Argiope bruennichi]|uniref:DUF5641 domain-containing protein n=1 Tax=Argiope bruennichi TaxID=94029 RepID=A0A8T0E4A7_ARGBR|nr:hypothetical protein HNY73_019417 [Argiope bruennichi]